MLALSTLALSTLAGRLGKTRPLTHSKVWRICTASNPEKSHD